MTEDERQNRIALIAGPLPSSVGAGQADAYRIREYLNLCQEELDSIRSWMIDAGLPDPGHRVL